jgi:LacI family transcriptional regulator
VVGIRELARECGVSVATVSRALNGHPEVSDVTRRVVQETAARLGYRPRRLDVGTRSWRPCSSA